MHCYYFMSFLYFSFILQLAKVYWNKKVFLRERKRHTGHRVVSTPSVVLTGYPPPRQGTPPSWPGQGVPYLGTPQQGTFHPDLAGGYPTWVPPGRAPPQQGTPPAGPGRVSPQVSAPWHSGKCCKALWDMGTPPGVNKLTKWNYYLPFILRTRAVTMRKV